MCMLSLESGVMRAEQIEERDEDQETSKRRHRPLQAINEERRHRDPKQQQYSDHGEKRMGPQTHGQLQQPLACHGFAKLKVRTEDDQPHEKHSGDRSPIKREESIIRRED